MDSTTSDIVQGSEQETTIPNMEVSLCDEQGVSNLAVCEICNRGYLISKGCTHKALSERKPVNKYKIEGECIVCHQPVYKRKTVCHTCRKALFPNIFHGVRIVCKYCGEFMQKGDKLACQNCQNMLK